MDIYENISELIYTNPKFIDDIVKLKSLNIDISKMNNYMLRDYFVKQEKERYNSGVINSIEMIQLSKWIYNEGCKKGEKVGFEKFLENLLSNQYQISDQEDDFKAYLDCWYSISSDYTSNYYNGECNEINEFIEKICNYDTSEVYDNIYNSKGY